MSYLSLSTWSLHRKLGPLHWTVWDKLEKRHRVNVENQPEKINLLDLPAILHAKGFKAMEVCHFHFQRTDSDYLQKLRNACHEANILFHTLLVDYGDISSADETRRNMDVEFIKHWIDIASEVGAERVRVVAGESAPDDHEALRRTMNQLNKLIEYAKPLDVRIVTENFLSLTSKAENCLQLIHGTNKEMGIITDFGNFKGAEKYEELEKILPYSDSIHAKANFDSDGIPDVEEFQKCLDLLPKINYNGPITLIYDGPFNMWKGIERVRKIVEPYL